MRATTVEVLRNDMTRHQVRCVYRIGALAVAGDLWNPGPARKRDRAWGVIHIPTGARFPTRPLTAAEAERVLLAVGRILKWERYERIGQVAALGKRTKARIHAVLAEVRSAPKQKGGGR